MIRPMNRSKKRQGIGAFELLLVLPLLIVVLLAALQFSAMLSAEDRVAEASRQGARVAAGAGEEAAVRKAVKDALGKDIFEHTTTTIKYTNSSSGGTGAVSVLVTVSVPAKYVTPNYLKIIGIDSSEESVVGHTVMRMESVK